MNVYLLPGLLLVFVIGLDAIIKIDFDLFLL